MTEQDQNSRIVLWTSLFAIVLSIVVSLGWIFDIKVFKTILPGYVSMKLNTAVFFLLTASILIFLIKKKWQLLTLFLAIALTIYSAASLTQDIFNTNFGIDQLFINDLDAISRGEASPGRPSPTTSFSFFLFGLVFLMFSTKQVTFRKIRQYALHLITLIAFIAILGYAFNVPSLYKLSIFTSMAIHTSVTLFILSISVTILNPDLGVTRLFMGKKIGNLMARSLFIKIIGAVLVLGFLQLSLERYNLVSMEFGIALFTTCFILVALFFLGSTVDQLNTIDTKRSNAENALVLNNKNLENTVKERTLYLTRQNKQLEDFAYIVSHNLRGPASNLKTLLTFYNVEKDAEEKSIIMDKFNITVNNLEGTLNELLEVVSIRHGSKKEKEKLEFETVLVKLIESYQGKIMETKAKITYDFSSVETIEYSSVYLESIMQNLLSNAIKYRSLERNPVIHFETDLEQNQPCLKVSDNGLGINMERNGDRLFGLHKTFHQHPDAKGVGLFITKAQVEAMGGEILAESEVDKGTTFKIKFNQT